MSTDGIIIIGNGITGITAACSVRRNHPEIRIRIISSESDYFFSRTALMYIYMGQMRLKDTEVLERDFYREQRLELIRDLALSILPEKKQILLKESGPLTYDRLLLALGGQPNRFGWPGETLENVTGLYSLGDLQTLESAGKNAKRAVLVGGGLIGVEMAEMLRSRGMDVTFLVREKSYMDYVLPPEESEMVNNEIRSHGVDLRLSTGLKELKGEKHVEHAVTDSGEIIPCDLAGLTAGVRPNTELARQANIQVKRGICVDERFRTSGKDIFAAGDCAEFVLPDGKGKVEQLWYTGKKQGESVGRILAALDVESQAPYDPGIFFNSARFFSLEYQVYGQTPLTGPSVFYRHPSGKKSIRLCYEQFGQETRIKGFLLMGVRYRHALCEAWIREERSVAYVLDHLSEANFDPEFFSRHEPELKRIYMQGASV